MALCKITPPAISLTEYTLYSPLLHWYFCSRVSVTIEDEFFTALTSTSSLGFPFGGLGSMDWTSSLCFRPIRPFVKFSILNSIICLPLFDVCGQWPLLVIFWFSVQLWARCNNFCVVGSLLCYQFSLYTLSRFRLVLYQTEVWDLSSPNPGGVIGFGIRVVPTVGNLSTGRCWV